MTWHRLQKTASRWRRSMRLALLTSKLTGGMRQIAPRLDRATWGRGHWHRDLKSPASLHAKARRPQARVLRSGGRARVRAARAGAERRSARPWFPGSGPGPAAARWSERPPASSLLSPAPTSVGPLQLRRRPLRRGGARPEEPLEAPPERQGTTVAPCHPGLCGSTRAMTSTTKHSPCTQPPVGRVPLALCYTSG